MSNQIFNEIGLQGPTPIGGLVARGATVVPITAGHATIAFKKGEVVEMTWTGHDTDPDKVKFLSILEPTPPAITTLGLNTSMKIYGVCLDDIAALATTGRVMLRGSCLAYCEGGGTVDITTGVFMYTGDGTASTGMGSRNGSLDSIRNATISQYIKPVAIYAGATAITTATAGILRPVIFNGIEGFPAGYVEIA